MEKIHIRNLIFDLGNVIINIDPPRSVKAFAELVPEQAEAIQNQLLKTDFFNKFETGEIDNEAFRKGIREIYQNDLSDAQIDDCWNTLLLDIPQARVDLLQELKKNFRIFLLSNTNDIHARAVEATLAQLPNAPLMTDIFEKVYYSQNMGLRKPDPQIYRQVLGENNLQAEETLFLDDNLDNVKSAQTLGIHIIHIQPGKNSMLDFFQKEESGTYQVLL